MSQAVKTPKKLIEAALPLGAINVGAAREKSIRYGHPSTLHLWWARRPLAATRAVIFAQMMNDPGYRQGGGFKYGMNREKAAIERERLLRIIERLVKWDTNNGGRNGSGGCVESRLRPCCGDNNAIDQKAVLRQR